MDDLISKLSEIRSKYNCLDEAEEPYYRALSEAIKKLSGGADGDTISRQAAIDAVEESRRLNHHQDGKEACAHEYEHRHFLKILRDLPSAQPERKKGEWITQEFGSWAECSECHELYDIPMAHSNFCPNCGADMRGAERREE